MTELLQILEGVNNREKALIICSFVIFLFSLLSKKIRNTYKSLFFIFLNKEICVTLLLFFSYISLISFFFHKINFFEVNFLKETILWTLFAGLTLVWKFATDEKQHKLFQTILVDSLTIIFVLEFIIDTYVFSFWKEIILVSSVSLLAFFETILGTNKDLKSAQNLIRKILSLIGLTILGFALYYTVLDIENFLTFGTLKSLLYPVVLTIFSFLFFYIFVLILKLDTVFNRIKNKTEERKLEWKAKYIIFKNCVFSLSKIEKVINTPRYDLYMISSEKDLEELDKAYQNKY